MASRAGNQRQLYLSAQFYADDFDRYIPSRPGHTGWGGMAYLSEYWYKYAGRDAKSGHVYRALGHVFATGYIDQKEVLLCPDWINNTTTGGYANSSIAHMGVYRWEKFVPVRDNYKAPTWSMGNYVCYSVAGEGTLSDGRLGKDYRNLDRPAYFGSMELSTLLMCFQVGYFETEVGSHGKKTMNALYDDGHVVTIPGVDTFQEEKFLFDPSGSSNLRKVANDAINRTGGEWNWWVWVESHK